METKKAIGIQLFRAIDQHRKHPEEGMYWQGQMDALTWVLQKVPYDPPVKSIDEVVNPIKKSIAKALK